MTVTETITTQLKSLVDDVKGLPETLKKVDIADLQKQATGFAQVAATQATAVYTDLAKKSEDIVAKAKGIKVDDVTTQAKSFADDATKQAKGFAGDAQKRAETLVADAKASVSKVTGKAPAAKAPTAPKAPTTKA